MAKTADRYFKTDPWKIIEDGFDPAYSEVSESVFSLGNEYMGVRGYFEEGYTGASMTGSYFNGIYEQDIHKKSGYKGITNVTEFMVNSVNWLYTRICFEGETLDLAASCISSFQRTLDLRNGVLTRSLIWKTQSGKEIAVLFERFLSMQNPYIGCQKIRLQPIGFDGEIRIHAGLDASGQHKAYEKNFWRNAACETGRDFVSLMAQTVSTGQRVYSGCRFSGDILREEDEIVSAKTVEKVYILPLRNRQNTEINRIALNYVCKEPTEEAVRVFTGKCLAAEQASGQLHYETIKEDSTAWWTNVWEHSDITIEGDVLNQQGIRFCIFQMFQTYHGAVAGDNIGAKGLTGEAYNGNAFWDTETYCLPFFIFNDMQAAKSLLIFRYVTLPEAMERAKELDCDGAFYPIATISGKECCNLWQHASLQLQASTAVAYGIWLYEKYTGDRDFMRECGMPMLIEISRMLATRGSYTADGTRYGYYGVMGPDEFQMMVNHDCYTNYMARFTLQFTIDQLSRFTAEEPEHICDLRRQWNVSEREESNWSQMIRQMYIPYDERTGLFEQQEGFFSLPHIDVDSIPIEEFPLYHHWTYDRIYRNDMIKQPDVLMLMLLFNGSFTQEELRANYEYYEPRCIHESSLSPSVHSILANQLHKTEEAYDFFKFATRMDLDNYNRNTCEGLHTTSIAAAWMNIVYGFGGMRSDGEMLCFQPSVPKEWRSYSFRIVYHGDVIIVTVNSETATFVKKSVSEYCADTKLHVMIYGRETVLAEEPVTVDIPGEWKA
ncbi:MAG: glycosyl hydrolase family 65 protein [bacterium]|nr:glycosyl hydrolase family 65 protein [bacterium]